MVKFSYHCWASKYDLVQLLHENSAQMWLFQKIKDVYLKDPEKYVTLQDIVEAEREAHAAEWPKAGATLALMWLKRWALPEFVPSHCIVALSAPELKQTGSFLWFILGLSCRGLRFIQILLQSLADGERDENNPNLIQVNIVKAYEQALKKYHGWIVQKIFNVRKMFLFMLFLIINWDIIEVD